MFAITVAYDKRGPLGAPTIGRTHTPRTVSARQAWVKWVDDDGYRGLNAGPFELLAESRARLR